MFSSTTDRITQLLEWRLVSTNPRHCLQTFFQSIYDPSYLVELVAAAEYKLWDKDASMAKLGVPSGHTMDYENSLKHWDRYQNHYRRQNYLLRELCQDENFAAATMGATVAKATAGNTTASANTNPNTNPAVTADKRVTTRSVMKMFNNFVTHFEGQASEKEITTSGILRQGCLKVEVLSFAGGHTEVQKVLSALGCEFELKHWFLG